MTINLFKTVKPKNYKLDEREKIDKLKYNTDVLYISQLSFCLFLLFDTYNQGIDILKLSFAPHVNISTDIIISIFMLSFFISPFIAIKNNALFYTRDFMLGLLSSYIIITPIVNIINVDELIKFILHLIFIPVTYFAYLIYYNFVNKQ